MKNKKLQSTVAAVMACAVFTSQFSIVPAYATTTEANEAIENDGSSITNPRGIFGNAADFTIFAKDGIELTNSEGSLTTAKILAGGHIYTQGGIVFNGSGVRVISYGQFVGDASIVGGSSEPEQGGVTGPSASFILGRHIDNMKCYMQNDGSGYTEQDGYIMLDDGEDMTFDYNGTISALSTASTNMASIATPGTAIKIDGGVANLTYAGTEPVVLFKLNKNTLDAAPNGISVTAPNGTAVIVSISSGGADITVPTITTNIDASNFLINIADTNMATLTNVPGCLLAPNTYIMTDSTPVGQVVAEEYKGAIPTSVGGDAVKFNTSVNTSTAQQGVLSTVREYDDTIKAYVAVPVGTTTLQLKDIVDTTTKVPTVTVDGVAQEVTLSDTGYDTAALTNVNINSVVEIKEVDRKFNITLPTSADYTVESVDGYEPLVYRGGDYQFEVIAAGGKDINNITVLANGNAVTEITALKTETSRTYEISDVLADYTITIDGVGVETNTVTIPNVPGYTITTDKDPLNLHEGEDITITITPNPGYSTDGIVVKADGEEISPNPDGSYTIEDVTDDTEITIAGTGLETNTVTIPNVPGYTITTDKDPSNIPYGEDLTLTITPNPGYSDDITVKVNGEEIPVTGTNTYVIENITEDISISINGVQDEYTVTFPTTQTGYTITATTPTTGLNYGDDVSFKITAASGYNTDNVVVKANGKVIAAVNGVYTIEDIANDITVTVEGVVISEYTVTNTVPAGVTFNSTEKDNVVASGESYSFTLTVADGYDAKDMVVKVNGVALAPVNGVYTIKNITSNQQIVVSGVAVKFLTVAYSTLPTGVTTTPGTTSTIEYGKDFTFTVAADAKYDVTNMIVTANNIVLKGTQTTTNTMQYTISGVKENQAILISGLKEKTYSINVTDCEGATTILPSSTIVAGGTLNFTVNVDSAYDKDSLQVIVNNMLVTPVNGVYSVKDVSSNISIVTSGLSKAATYTINIPAVEGVRVTTSSTNTVKAGESFTFQITPLADYNISNMKVTANGVTIPSSNGTYTIKDIQANQNVVISGVQKQKYTITSQALSGITISTSDSYVVEKGGSFTFKLLISSSIDPTTVSVKVNGIPLVGSSWTYTISNITENKDIVVTANNIVLNDSNSTTTKPDVDINGFGTSSDPYEKDDGKVIVTGDDPVVNTALATTMGLSAIAGLIAVFGKKFDIKKIFEK